MITSSRSVWLALNFAATIFVSAFLLFQIEPLVSKYILPWFGGTPAVWTTCLLFFQTLLFCGYAYAHFSQMWLRPKQQAIVHVALIIVALIFLRVVPTEAWKPTDSLEPVGKILTLLTASVGLPFFVLSSTGPLIQAWFARAYPGRIPYRLYALSNVGSLLALLSYPFYFERIWAVQEQATFWSCGFYLYAALCGCAAVVIGWALRATDAAATDPNVTDLHSANPVTMQTPQQTAGDVLPVTAPMTGAKAETFATPTILRRVMWLALPAFASVALLAITNHVCTDVAVMPFLWVVPLSLYLVTFIIAFDHPRWYRPVLMSIFTALAIYTVALVFHNGQSEIELYDSGTPGKIAHFFKYHRFTDDALPEEERPESPSIKLGFMTYAGMNFAALLGICMLCHGELFRLRPHPQYLTGYYLMISAGGALGGVAVSLMAPRLFVTFVEWNLALFFGFVLACWLILRGILSLGSSKNARGAAAGANLERNLVAAMLALPVLVIAGFGIYDICTYFQPQISANEKVALRTRNFFGTLRVEDRKIDDPDNEIHVLYHGRITHGLQYTSEDRRHIPTTYYAPETGVGRTIGFYREDKNQHGMRIGAVGLGTGTLAAYAEQGDSIRFYEINPDVIKITEPGEYFTYLKDCKQRGGKYEIELGDARLTLERELQNHQPQKFNILVLDAFSGDAIPVHLLTEEAFQSYADHLSKAADGDVDGAIAIHITNRYVDLEPIVLGLAEHFGFDHVLIVNDGGDNQMYRSDWMILTHNRDLLAALSKYGEPPPEERSPPQVKKKPVLWTDGRSNLFDVLK